MCYLPHPASAPPQDDDATAALLWMARHDAGSEDNAAEAAALWEACGAALRRSALDKLVPREGGGVGLGWAEGRCGSCRGAGAVSNVGLG